MGAESRDPPPPASPSSDPAGDAASPAAFSIDFGSPSALEQIRSLTDVGAMTRLLHECIAYQRSLDLNLSSLLSQRPDLDRHLSSLLRSTHLLDLARHDSSLLLSSVQSTSSLADKVSRKVRQLDLAQSRVSDTLSRIDAIIHRSHSLDRARRALDADDFPACADAVRSFLQIDSQFDLDPGSEHSQLVEIKTRLETLTRSRLSTAIANRDHPAVLRYIRIFPPLGIHDEGLQLYVSYLRKVISLRSRLEFEHLSDLAAASAQPDFIGCLTGLFKDIVLAVEENDEVLRGLSGEDGIVYAICELQEECETRGTQILKKYMDYRRLARLASEVNSRGSNLLSGAPQGPEPREVEIFLEEILSLTQLGEDYTEFMVSKIRSLGSLKDDLAPRAMMTFRSGNFSKVVQDLTGFYVVFEEFFMVENVMKALSIDEHVPDSLTTSMVEDVFFVLQSCSRRAVSTANSSSVLAVISRAMNLLSGEYQDTLERKIRESNSGVRLFVGGVGVQKTGEEIAVALNNVDVSAEYVLKLRREIEEQCLEMFTAPADREKVKSCLSELTEINSRFKKLLNDGMDQLVMMVTPRIRPVLDSVATVSYELSDAEYEGNEENDPWVRKLLHTVESNMVWLQPVMTSNNYDAFIHQVIDFVVKRLEVIMMQKRFNQLGGLQLDREVRSLVNHFSERSQRPVRDKFARLSQMSTILNFERVSEILDFWGENAGHMTWLLTPSEVRRVLGLRLDFKPEAIAALRL